MREEEHSMDNAGAMEEEHQRDEDGPRGMHPFQHLLG